MLSRRTRQSLHPTLHLLAAGGRQWARDAGQLAVCRLVGGLLLALFLFSRAVMPPQIVHPVLSPFRMNGKLKLMIITLEFRKGTFSGNGVYAQSIARSLARKGHEVLVISGNPVKNTSRDNVKSGDAKRNTSEIESTRGTIHETFLNKDPISGLIELEVDVEDDGWGRLDWKCPWESFGNGIRAYALHVLKFGPSWALVVDWSAIPAYEELSQSVSTEWRMAFLNFRVYTVSEYQGENGQAEKQFYKEMESKAVAMASAISALSSRDAHILATDLGAGIRPAVVPKPHFPPLRGDLRALAMASQAGEGFGGNITRKLFTCCVRISPEKNTELFASLVEILAEFLRQQQIIPFLCGGATQGGSTYAGRVKAKLKRAMPEAIIHEGFMGPSQLADLYSRTLLNLHPCIYDAYGMTIIEAAAFAAPSVVHVGPGGAVGAAEFLDPEQGQVLGINLTASLAVVADSIKSFLLNTTYLAEVAQEASMRSLTWDEDANADQLIAILETAPDFTIRS